MDQACFSFRKPTVSLLEENCKNIELISYHLTLTSPGKEYILCQQTLCILAGGIPTRLNMSEQYESVCWAYEILNGNMNVLFQITNHCILYVFYVYVLLVINYYSLMTVNIQIVIH